jgi:hypothetical protein
MIFLHILSTLCYNEYKNMRLEMLRTYLRKGLKDKDIPMQA